MKDWLCQTRLIFGVFPDLLLRVAFWMISLIGLVAVISVAVPWCRWRTWTWLPRAAAIFVAIGALFVIAHAASEDDYTRNGLLRWSRHGGHAFDVGVLVMSSLVALALVLLPVLRHRVSTRLGGTLCLLTGLAALAQAAAIVGLSVGN